MPFPNTKKELEEEHMKEAGRKQQPLQLRFCGSNKSTVFDFVRNAKPQARPRSAYKLKNWGWAQPSIWGSPPEDPEAHWCLRSTGLLHGGLSKITCGKSLVEPGT